MSEALSLWKGPVVYRPPPAPSMRQLAQEVAERHGLTLEDLIGPRVLRKIAHARQEAMWVIRQHTRNSTTRIGQYFGGRDHTTVLHACRVHERRTVVQ